MRISMPTVDLKRENKYDPSDGARVVNGSDGAITAGNGVTNCSEDDFVGASAPAVPATDVLVQNDDLHLLVAGNGKDTSKRRSQKRKEPPISSLQSEHEKSVVGQTRKRAPGIAAAAVAPDANTTTVTAATAATQGINGGSSSVAIRPEILAALENCELFDV
jgi:hypothetical protein